MLDREGYRPNVGIILCNARNEVFWGKRIREHSWQFPQGGIKRGETPEQAMYRELHEEIGLLPEHVFVLGRTKDWLRYDVPTHWVRREWRGSYRGSNGCRIDGSGVDRCLRLHCGWRVGHATIHVVVASAPQHCGTDQDGGHQGTVGFVLGVTGGHCSSGGC